MDSVIVTVVIPAYNEEGVIADCLSSLEAQDFPRDQMQIIVGDNGSTDSTLQIIADSFPKVEVVSASERGSSYARNAAILVARGRYICSIDADCVADKGWFSTMVRAFEESPELVACLGGQTLPYRVKTIVEHYQHVWIQQRNLREGKERFCYAEASNAAFRRNVFDQIGLFDETQGHDDVDMGLRLTAAGLSMRYVPDAIVYHHNPTNITELYRERVKYGSFMVRLSNKYPEKFGLMYTPAAVRHLALATVRRVAGDIFFKLPFALFTCDDSYGTRLWPLLDAVVAFANYVGVCREFRSMTRDKTNFHTKIAKTSKG